MKKILINPELIKIIESTLIEEYSKDNIEIILSFEKSGINSARVDFDLKKEIDTPHLIELLESTCNFVDRILFPSLKEDLLAHNIIKNDILNEHMTYSIISSTDANINIWTKDLEIIGISWKQKNYSYLDKKIREELISNNIPIYKGDILLVTTQATLMVFFDVTKESYNLYVEERLNAIEMSWRQKHLLKKFYYFIDNLIEDVETIKTNGNLKNAIELIEKHQIDIQSELEIYRNTIISTTHSYSMLFDTLNKVFQLDKYYRFVQEKLNTCNNIYQGLYSEQRNDLMENIQWVVLILGVASIVLIVIGEILFGEDNTYKIIILLLILLITMILFKSRIINIIEWINDVK